MSFDRLIAKIQETKNPTVVGLDPAYSYVPNFLREKYAGQFADPLEGAAYAVLEYNKALIDAVCDIVPAVKPQAAYYELYGWYGVKTLAETITYAQKKGLYVITDGKRNDIGSTMEAYAAAHLGTVDIDGHPAVPFGGDALTVNGYLGSDGINPLLKICKEQDKGIFVLVKTSNPSSGELQDKKIGRKTVYEVMGTMCEKWNTRSSVRNGVFRRRRSGGSHLSRTAFGAAGQNAPHLLPGARIRRPGRRCQGCRRRF